MLSTALFFYRYRPRHFHFTRVIPRWNTYSSFSTHSLRRVAQRKCKSMVSRASDSSSKQRKSLGDLSNDGLGNLSYKLNQLKKQIQAERVLLIKEKLEKNRRKLQIDVSKLLSATSKRDTICLEESAFQKMPLCKYSGYSQAVGDKDYISSHEVVFTTSRKLPFIERIPPYTTWIFLDRNQRMAEDQSVVGRRRIYYDQHGSEALICSDSEEENIQPEEEKHEFTEGEDRILWMAFEEHGLCDEVTDIVSRFIGVANSEIQERYSTLKESYHDNNLKDSGDSGGGKGICLEKSLSAALDSFDNLFCRRCLLFDCRLHGCSQTLIDPSEKQPYWSEYEDDRNPCSDHCYLKLKASLDVLEGSATNVSLEKNDADKAAAIPSGSGKPGGDEGMDLQSPITLGAVSSLEVALEASKMDTSSVKIMGKRKALQLTDTSANESIQNPNDLHYSSSKRQKKVLALDVINASTDAISSKDANSSHVCIAGKGTNLQLTPKDSHSESVEHMADKYVSYGNVSHEKIGDNIGDRAKVVDREAELKQSSLKSGASKGASSGSEWKPIEKELYMKGVEIFGRNSCLIARNLLSGLKTCIEVSCYMRESGSSKSYRSGSSSSFLEENGKADTDYTDQEMPTRSRLLRRRGRARKLKYSWKSAGHPSFWKRIADGKNQSCKQYTPCGCQSMCGKQCPCLDNGTCCEKYCGCSKSCKNRFRGCHCAKSQCRSRQCPCFAAGRECDPDVCRNCWVSCGDGTLSEPARRGDGQCGNMRLLLRQQQRILLAKSDIAGWGAFLKNSVNKNDYLGEYTGELISHREADKRGNFYDRANSSFLFDLNDQYVLDAYRKGDKLKFANHSSNPNCYAKVMLVAGDHRVGIFAKEHIEAKKELFYDYRYGPDQAPAWARKPDSSKNDESSFSQGRAKKHQSH